MPEQTKRNWLPHFTTIVAVLLAAVFQYHAMQAAIKSQEEKERLSEMAAELFEGMAKPAGAGATLIAQAHAKAAIYGNADVIAAFTQLLTDTGNDNLANDMAALVMAVRCQAGTSQVDKRNIAKLLASQSRARGTKRQ